jgi:hypothetical protein
MQSDLGSIFEYPEFGDKFYPKFIEIKDEFPDF